MNTRLTRSLLKTGGNKERANIVWNMVGSFCYAFASMVLSFLVMRVVGEEEGGIFSFGFSTFGQQMFILAYFGIRPFQITDGTGEYSFGDYLGHRVITCMAAVTAAAGWLFFSGYSPKKIWILFLLVLYKVVDAFADVFESEFQRNGRLYLTGKSNTFRTVLSVGAFLGALIASRNLLLSCMVAVAAQVAGMILFDFLVLGETDGVVYEKNRGSALRLFKGTSLLFVSVFMDFYIFSAAKYAIDARMENAASGYFNVIFMPTSMINLAAGFVIRPFLTYMTEYWVRRRLSDFKRSLWRITMIIVAVTMLAVGVTWMIGRPVLAIMEGILGPVYEGKLTAHHLSFVMIVLGGGFYALLSLYYYVLVIMRKQKLIFSLYVVLTIVAACSAIPMVERFQIPGAAMCYLMLMILMAAGFGAGALVSYRKESSQNTARRS